MPAAKALAAIERQIKVDSRIFITHPQKNEST